MLYKFKSRVTGDLIMLQPNGQRILRIIGLDKPGTPSGQGILLPEQIPGAIAALQAAVAQEEAQQQAWNQLSPGHPLCILLICIRRLGSHLLWR
jgi:hypothetical protein